MNGVYLTIAAPLLGAVLGAMPLSNRMRVALGASVGILLLSGVVWTNIAGPENLVLVPAAAHALGTAEVVGDSLLLLYFLWVAWERRSLWAGITGVLNLGLFVYITAMAVPAPRIFLHADGLARFFLLVIALVAPAIWVWSPFYHRHYGHVVPGFSERPYYFWLFAIVGVMNALVTVNGLMDLYLLWELTTLASFLLIDSPRSPEARASAVRALWMNGVGGVAFLAGTLWLAVAAHHLSLIALVRDAHAGPVAALLALAAAVKAAQFPFSRWLLGAMVAPAPVSALLHSSTMVKAGIYLALRLSPVLHQTLAGTGLAWAGGLSFLGAAWLAAGSRDTKEVLAYSTISNLGLMLAMAGVGSPDAVTAALILVSFHALGKALLFLVAGSIESDLGSREVEAAGGLAELRPQLGLLGMWGIISLYMPPLGLLLAKWMALEASAKNLPLYVLLAIGSGLTGFFWTKILGRYACAATTPDPATDRLPPGAYAPLWYLAAAVACGSVAVLPVSRALIEGVAAPLAGPVAELSTWSVMVPWYAALVSAVLLLAFVRTVLGRARRPRALPYLSGVEVTGAAPAGRLGHFRSSADQEVVASLAGFYPSAKWEAGSERVFFLAGMAALLGMVLVTL